MHNINKNIGRIALVFIPYVILVLFATFGLRFCEWCDEMTVKIKDWTWNEDR